MFTKSVIVVLSLLAMVNRSLSFKCVPCPDRDCGPSPTCPYGVTKDDCNCCDICRKGPGEQCGGYRHDPSFIGRCAEYLDCKLIPSIHQYIPVNRGICIEQGKYGDECKDTWPSTECTTVYLHTPTNKSYTEVPACSCEDVVAEGLCTDSHLHLLSYQNLANVCKLSCDLCGKPMMPMPYAFKYNVADEEYGVQMAHNVDSDGNVTVGEYSVMLPDGRLQIVKYRSDAENGYQAEVTYQ